VALFEAERPALLSLGYRMLGERAGAEDVVQETWLRWAAAEQAGIQNPAAWLRRTATNIAIDVLRSARARREDYVGPWLPEPLIDPEETSPGAKFELAQECELALLWAMEHLNEIERAAFILREAFDAGYDEIAATLNKSEAACRQLVSRAHKRLGEAGPRFDADEKEVADLIQRFFTATMAGDRQTALSLLSPKAVALSDGGGKARAALRPLNGPEDITQVLLAVFTKDQASPDFSFEVAMINRKPCLCRYHHGILDTVTTLSPDSLGKIAWIYTMRNPDKLRAS
ncbi:MAG: RNA polymerase sigma factor SigJ, partial [Pseudomonadota bacterium]